MTNRSTGARRLYTLSRAAAALAFALLAGCATGPRLLRIDVTTFNDWSALPTPRTYVFSRTLEFQNSLEVQAYEAVARDELALQGFVLASDGSTARLTVTLRPTVTSTRVRVHDGWGDAFYGGYGGYGGFGFSGRGAGWSGVGPGWYGGGWGPYGGYNGFGYNGFGGFGGGGYAVELYQRRLEMDIDSRTEPGKRYYEGKVENSGDTESMAAVMPYLVRALFADFPGNNAQTRRVDVQMAPRPPPP